MLTVIMTVLDVLVLGMLVLDYLRTNEYVKEHVILENEIRKLNYHVCELEDKLRGCRHG